MRYVAGVDPVTAGDLDPFTLRAHGREAPAWHRLPTGRQPVPGPGRIRRFEAADTALGVPLQIALGGLRVAFVPFVMDPSREARQTPQASRPSAPASIRAMVWGRP